MGFIGTWFGKWMIGSLGLLRAGCSALVIQTSLLVAAAAVYASCLQPATALVVPGGGKLALGGPAVHGVPLAVAAFAACVVLSRVGMWSIDMVNSQLFQQTVRQREMASASSAEMALCSVSEVVMLAIAAASASPSAYPLLVYGRWVTCCPLSLLVVVVWCLCAFGMCCCTGGCCWSPTSPPDGALHPSPTPTACHSLSAVIAATLLFTIWARQAQPSIDVAMQAAA